MAGVMEIDHGWGDEIEQLASEKVKTIDKQKAEEDMTKFTVDEVRQHRRPFPRDVTPTPPATNTRCFMLLYLSCPPIVSSGDYRPIAMSF